MAVLGGETEQFLDIAHDDRRPGIAQRAGHAFRVGGVGGEIAGADHARGRDIERFGLAEQRVERMPVAVGPAEKEDGRVDAAEVADALHRPPAQSALRLQAPPPSTQKRAQCGWFRGTAPDASARVCPISKASS